MEDFNAVEILIVEDNPRDAELTLRALKKNNLANNILVAKDGAEALDFFFCRGKFEKRTFTNPPKVVLLDLKPVSYTHLRAHETPEHLVCRLLLEKKKK